MIKKPVYDIFTETQNSMMGYAMLFGVNAANICIKPDGMALLSVVINYNGEKKIEEVADLIYGEGEEQHNVMFLYPKGLEHLVPLIEGVRNAHPEFKIEVLSDDNEQQQEESTPDPNMLPFGASLQQPDFKKMQVEDSYSPNGDAMKYRYLKITTAPVTKEQRKIYLDTVESLFTYCKTRIDAQNAKMEADLKPVTKDYAKLDHDEVEKLAKNIHETNIDNLKKLREEKEQEIEEGYQRYLKEHNNDGDNAFKGKQADSNAPATPDVSNMLKL